MRLKPEQLAGALKKGIAPVYLLTGDEPLLIEESSDLIRQHLTANGFSEREVLHVDGGFNWNYLLESSAALSLFAERKLIELRLGSQKMSKQASEAVRAYLQNPPPDNVLLIIADKLDAAAKKSAWCKAVEQTGAMVEIWPVEIDQLPAWLRQRASQMQLQLDDSAVNLLCERVEGNLLAARQELAKLQLLFPQGQITGEDIIGAVSDSSRYDIFGLTDAAVSGQPERCHKVIQVLRQDGSEPAVVLWALSREIRTLYQIQRGLEAGQAFDGLCQKERVWGKRKNQVKRACQRLSRYQFEHLLQQAAQVDQIVKGAARGDAWLLLTNMAITLAGRELPLFRLQG